MSEEPSRCLRQLRKPLVFSFRFLFLSLSVAGTAEPPREVRPALRSRRRRRLGLLLSKAATRGAATGIIACAVFVLALFETSSAQVLPQKQWRRMRLDHFELVYDADHQELA
ncbi:MAG: hypothetical protein C5B49_12040, partial [Bdellovibrio sp.]